MIQKVRLHRKTNRHSNSQRRGGKERAGAKENTTSSGQTPSQSKLSSLSAQISNGIMLLSSNCFFAVVVLEFKNYRSFTKPPDLLLRHQPLIAAQTCSTYICTQLILALQAEKSYSGVVAITSKGFFWHLATLATKSRKVAGSIPAHGVVPSMFVGPNMQPIQTGAFLLPFLSKRLLFLSMYLC